jgi:hypothetical protein
MSNFLRISTSAFAIAALLGVSASAQARDYRHVGHRHARVGHSYYYGGSPHYGGPSYNAPASPRYGYGGGTNGGAQGGSSAGQFMNGSGP